MWSAGASLVEKGTACNIFGSKEEYDELSQIIQCHCQPSVKVLDHGKETAFYFCHQKDTHGDLEDRKLFVNLLKMMLQLDQHERITPLEVSQLPFLTDSLPQSPLVTCTEENTVSLPDTDEHWWDLKELMPKVF
ncbi:hypothetical protein D4764_07G0007640 [Takifugu flavidus]|uniref:Uncharacterized protein n=1 Tax=Takifugu flavidus TaxID=433684 RepID=A0A5C6MT81_9TELE|nr:hypothetical protein D4764_07G0007640 [Takifugu flavidus]